MQAKLKQNPGLYEEVLSETFDCLGFADKIGRIHTLPMIGQHFLNKLDELDDSYENELNHGKLITFLNNVQKGYYESVQYHNDLHGADVMQMSFLFLHNGGLARIANLNYLDMVSFIVAGACHDFGHDGFNNAFHVNSMS